jgi:hypothetical protein
MREDLTTPPLASRTSDIVAPANGAAANGAGPHGAAPNGDAEVPPWAGFSAARGRFVRAVIVFSLALTVLASASIYWRWANVYEPTSYIMVLGNESLDGTLVVVNSPDFPESMATLSKENNYAAAIFLHPGSYTVTATLNGEQLARSPFAVSGRNAATLNLNARHPGRGRVGATGTSGASRAAGSAS